MCENGFFRRLWKLFFGIRAKNEIEYKPLRDREYEAILSIESVSYCIAENGRDHRTHLFEVMKRSEDPCLVVRRCYPFLLDITLSRPYIATIDAISFIFTLADAEHPNHGEGTLITIPLLPVRSNNPLMWSASIHKLQENHLFVKILTSHESIIGKWKMDIDTKLKDVGSKTYSHPIPFYLLFNPWRNKDSVHIGDDGLLHEFVLLDVGLIWRGTHNRLRPTPWKYAQYEKDILDCALYIITEIGNVKGYNRADPVLIARGAAAAINSMDNKGVLVGNWSGDYVCGTQPTRWLGSMEILQKYYKTKKPVKYGQCWVFAGVLTTVLRAIGIPCRVITAYNSAQTTPNSLTVNYFLNENGSIIENLMNDSVWNYHVWNEAWMTRPDLGNDYVGWQAIDATHQDSLDNRFRCGPSSVTAIKKGELKRSYNNRFIFSEINADKIYWKYAGPTHPMKLICNENKTFGKNMSTKAPGSWKRADVTNSYKFPDDNVEKKVTLEQLIRLTTIFSRYYVSEQFNDIKIIIKFRDDIIIGENFRAVVTILNRSNNQGHQVDGIFKIDTMFYNGKIGKPVMKIGFEKIVAPNSSEEIIANVTFDNYYKQLVDQCDFNVSCYAAVNDKNCEYFIEDVFRVRKPDISITLQNQPITDQEYAAIVKLENPLPIPLKKCKFIIEGVGLDKQIIIRLNDNVPPHGFVNVTVNLTPHSFGLYTLIAKFTSNELDDVDGFLGFRVNSNDLNRSFGTRVYKI